MRKLTITKESLFADKKRIFQTLEAFKSKYNTQSNQLNEKFDNTLEGLKSKAKILY